VVFGHDELIAKALNLPRKGALNFVVGVNGTGKSSLLRALYRIFRSLNLREWPALPVTIAWDRTISGEAVTALLHSTNLKFAQSFFATVKQVSVTARRQDWESITVAMSKGEQHHLVEALEIATGSEAITSPLLFARLPKRLIAYTSGTDDSWVQIDQPEFHSKDEEEGQYQTERERPQGWSIDREWEEEQPIRISNVLTRYAMQESGATQRLPGVGPVGELTRDAVTQLQQEIKPLEEIRRKMISNRMPRTERLDESYFRVPSHQLRFAGVTLGLWQAAKELPGYAEESERAKLRDTLVQPQSSADKPTDARRVLNEIDWFWPTHLSLTYRDADDRVSPVNKRDSSVSWRWLMK